MTDRAWPSTISVVLGALGMSVAVLLDHLPPALQGGAEVLRVLG